MRSGASEPQSIDRRRLFADVVIAWLREADFGHRPADLRALSVEDLARERVLEEVEPRRAHDLLQAVVGALGVAGDAPIHRGVEERFRLLRRRLRGAGELLRVDLSGAERRDASDPAR